MNHGDILECDGEKMETSGNGAIYIESVSKRLFLLGMFVNRERV